MTTELNRISSQAPTRIDLAGGTVDLWPLYLFLRDARTVNLGIDLYAETRLLVTEGAPGVELSSDDQGAKQELSWDEVLGQTEAPPNLALHLKLLRHFAREKRGFDKLDISQRISLSTLARSPAGAGLGGSSTLSISMVGAIATWARGTVVSPEFDGEGFIEIVRDTETTVIQVPAGLQDYYGAMYGGLQSLRWGAGTHGRARLGREAMFTELERRLLLFYSGSSRNSGINNWALFKAFIDKQEQVRERFQSIVDSAIALETALSKSDWSAASRAIASEWAVRRTLAKGISTPEIERAFEIATAVDPENSGKICGAGGGGCFFVFVPSGKIEIRERLTREICAIPGVRQLPFRIAPLGLEVRTDHA